MLTTLISQQDQRVKELSRKVIDTSAGESSLGEVVSFSTYQGELVVTPSTGVTDRKYRVKNEDLRGIAIGLGSSVRHLDFYECGLTGDGGIEALKVCTELASLKLSCCRELTSEALPQIGALRGLRSLNLHSTQVGNGDPELFRALVDLVKLRELGLGNTGLTDEGLSMLASLPDLRELRIHMNQGITDEGVDSLLAHQNLERLDIGETSISVTGISRLRELPRLNALSLHSTKLDQDATEVAEAISSFPALKEVNLTCCELGKESVLHIRRALPSDATIYPGV